MRYQLLFLACFAMLGLWIGCKRTPLMPEPATENQEQTDYKEALEKNRERTLANRQRDELTRAIRAYLGDMGKTPSNLTQLVEFDYIDKVPKAPDGLQYIYDNNKGNVQLVRLTPQQRSALAQQELQAELKNKGSEKAE